MALAGFDDPAEETEQIKDQITNLYRLINKSVNYLNKDRGTYGGPYKAGLDAGIAALVGKIPRVDFVSGAALLSVNVGAKEAKKKVNRAVCHAIVAVRCTYSRQHLSCCHHRYLHHFRGGDASGNRCMTSFAVIPERHLVSLKRANTTFPSLAKNYHSPPSFFQAPRGTPKKPTVYPDADTFDRIARRCSAREIHDQLGCQQVGDKFPHLR